MMVNSQSDVAAALSPGKETSAPNERMFGGPYSRSGRCEKVKNLCHCRKSNLEFSVILPVAYSLYWPGYAGSKDDS
jgi:hypothetical protein